MSNQNLMIVRWNIHCNITEVIIYGSDNRKEITMLITDRCYLQKIQAEDKKDIIKLYTNSETRMYLGGALSIQEADEKFDDLIKNHQIINNEAIYTVKLKNEKFIGLIYLSPYYDINFYEISYEFLPEYWGHGYAYEVMQEILNTCRMKFGLKKIYAETQTKNLRSRKLLEKLGYKKENELIRFNEDQTVYSINL